MKRNFVSALALLLLSTLSVGSAAVQFNRPPPGRVDRVQEVYFHGHNKNGRYIAVSSRRLLARPRPPVVVYQPYLTVYLQNASSNVARPIYQSPGDSIGLIPQVRQLRRFPMVFMPAASMQILGVGDFAANGRQELVVGVHTSAADCGMVDIHVLSLSARNKVTNMLQLQNYCRLSAAIARGRYLVLSGPYYAPGAALYRPTINNARSSVAYDPKTGRWSQHPSYFKLVQTNVSAPTHIP